MGIDPSCQNRWRRARERHRLKARYDIHSRIAQTVTSASADDCHNHHLDCDANEELTLDHLNKILKFLQAVVKNDLSVFSIASLARVGKVLERPLPLVSALNSFEYDFSQGIPRNGASSIEAAMVALSIFLSTTVHGDADLASAHAPKIVSNLQHQPATLATSKFGRDYVDHRLIPYMRHLFSHGGQLTLMEYASLLGRHGIVGLLLYGGIDPTVCGNSNVDSRRTDGEKERASEASRQVLALVHSIQPLPGVASLPPLPLSLWAYLVRSVVEMRINGSINASVHNECDTQKSDENFECRLCCTQYSVSFHQLSFGPPCHHIYCEPCIWIHLMQQVPNCTHVKQNVVTCPVCQVKFNGFQCCTHHDNQLINNMSEKVSFVLKECKEDNDVDYNSIRNVRERRRVDSLAKFMSLSASSSELKTTKKDEDCSDSQSHSRRKKIRDPIHSCWLEALHPIINGHFSRDVRSERFFKAVLSSPQMVLGYLEAGMDVNMQNVYGQTPLYVACWKGSATIVTCLLEYGADAGISANGGSTCWSVAKRLGRINILEILRRYPAGHDELNTRCTRELHRLNRQQADRGSKCHVTILIDPSADHQGAGACLVDDALSDEQLQRLDLLWRSLPVADSGNEVDLQEAFDGGRNQFRPTRSYYCDTEGAVQTMLKSCVDSAREALRDRSLSNENPQEMIASNISLSPQSVLHHIRFLHYGHKGGILPPHVDLCRVDDASGCRSTHTFILYLMDCDHGGGTALLQHLNDPTVLAIAQPKRGRALIFPHLCPHSGLEVESVPKLLLRGEVYMGDRR